MIFLCDNYHQASKDLAYTLQVFFPKEPYHLLPTM